MRTDWLILASPPPAGNPAGWISLWFLLLGLALLGLLALLLLTVLRWSLRGGGRPRRRRAHAGDERSLTPWEVAGRRADPLEDTGGHPPPPGGTERGAGP